MLVKTDRVNKRHQFKELNNAKKMTPEILRSFPGFENITDAEAKESITVMEHFCRIICRHISSK